MEKNITTQVKQGVGNCSADEWLAKYVNDQRLKSSITLNTTFGTPQNIPEFRAAYVFRPKSVRGQNGVMLTDFLGIGDINEILKTLCNEGYKEDIVWYPIGAPVSKKGLKVYFEACT